MVHKGNPNYFYPASDVAAVTKSKGLKQENM